MLWSHVEWLYRKNDAMLSTAEQERLAPDLADDKFYTSSRTRTCGGRSAWASCCSLIGGWSWLIWGLFVRIVVTYHITWLVNSAAHHSGYQTYRTGDKSTNNWFVAILAWGEGWHNNHHAFPFSARHGLRWFEFDFTYQIKALAALKLARDIKLPTPA